MALRKAAAYSKRKVTPYTRISKKKNKSFIKAVPPQKIVKFSMGDQQAYAKGKFPFHLTVVTEEKCQIRHNALEACRQFVNRKIEDTYPGQYVFRVMVFPHHIQREHRMLTGAGADRMSAGMQLSFGKAMGKAAIMKKGEGIFFMALNSQKAVTFARHLFKQIKAKLPCRTRVLYEEVKE
jgi:large subunit ribosomal protein L10e